MVKIALHHQPNNLTLSGPNFASSCWIVVKCELRLSSTAISVTVKFQSNLFMLTMSCIRYITTTHDKMSYPIRSWPRYFLTTLEINLTRIWKLIPELIPAVPWILSKVLHFSWELFFQGQTPVPVRLCLTCHLKQFEQSDWPKSNFINTVLEILSSHN